MKKREDLKFDPSSLIGNVSEEFGDDCLEAALAIFTTPKQESSKVVGNRKEQLDLQNDIKELRSSRDILLNVKEKMVMQNKMFNSVVAKMVFTVEEQTLPDKKVILQDKKILPKPESNDVDMNIFPDPMQDVLDSIFI